MEKFTNFVKFETLSIKNGVINLYHTYTFTQLRYNWNSEIQLNLCLLKDFFKQCIFKNHTSVLCTHQKEKKGKVAKGFLKLFTFRLGH